MEPEALHLAKYVVPDFALSLAKHTQMRFNALTGTYVTNHREPLLRSSSFRENQVRQSRV